MKLLQIRFVILCFSPPLQPCTAPRQTPPFTAPSPLRVAATSIAWCGGLVTVATVSLATPQRPAAAHHWVTTHGTLLCLRVKVCVWNACVCVMFTGIKRFWSKNTENGLEISVFGRFISYNTTVIHIPGIETLVRATTKKDKNLTCPVFSWKWTFPQWATCFPSLCVCISPRLRSKMKCCNTAAPSSCRASCYHTF